MAATTATCLKCKCTLTVEARPATDGRAADTYAVLTDQGGRDRYRLSYPALVKDASLRRGCGCQNYVKERDGREPCHYAPVLKDGKPSFE